MKFLTSIKPKFDSSTSEKEIANFVDQAVLLKRPSSVLVSILDESHPLYEGRGSNQVFRLQGYILASFEKLGLHKKALPLALEALESSMSIYMVAAGAKAIRGMKTANRQIVPYLLSAIENVYYKDDTVSFDEYLPRWPLASSTTALNEIFLTLQWMGNAANEGLPQLESWIKSNKLNEKNRLLLLKTIDIIQNDIQEEESCCGGPIQYSKPSLFGVSHKKILDVKLQDQEGETLLYKEYFKGHPTVVVFFYTRCENHNKCSLTINKLGKFQKLIKEKGLEKKVKTASISYDSVFDKPDVIKQYGLIRHAKFDGFNRSFRVLDRDKMSLILNYFDSSVNFNGNLVNKHQVELHVLDNEGKLLTSFTRLQWNPEEVVQTLESYLAHPIKQGSKWIETPKKIVPSFFNAVVPILIAFFPKCPLCWAAYLSLFGVAGISSIPYIPWLLPLFCVFLGINLWLLWRKASRQNDWLAFYLASAGALILVLFGPILNIEILSIFGIILLISGSLVSSFRIKPQVKFKPFSI